MSFFKLYCPSLAKCAHCKISKRLQLSQGFNCSHAMLTEVDVPPEGLPGHHSQRAIELCEPFNHLGTCC